MSMSKFLEPINVNSPGKGELMFLIVQCYAMSLSRVRLCDPMDCSLPGSSVHGDSPDKNTGVGCHALLQGIFPTQRLNPRLLISSSYGDYPGLLGWASVITRILKHRRGRQKRNQPEGDFGRIVREIQGCQLWRCRKSVMSQKRRWLPHTGEGKETDSLRDSRKECSPTDTLILAH